MSGALPTRTAVTILAGNDRIVLDGATEKQAGVMTSAHVDTLNRIQKAMAGLESGAPLVVERSADADLRATLADLASRIVTLERMPPAEPLVPLPLSAALPAPEATGLARIEHDLVQALEPLLQRVADVERENAALRRDVALLKQHAIVEVDTKIRQIEVAR